MYIITCVPVTTFVNREKLYIFFSITITETKLASIFATYIIEIIASYSRFISLPKIVIGMQGLTLLDLLCSFSRMNCSRSRPSQNGSRRVTDLFQGRINFRLPLLVLQSLPRMTSIYLDYLFTILEEEEKSFVTVC